MLKIKDLLNSFKEKTSLIVKNAPTVAVKVLMLVISSVCVLVVAAKAPELHGQIIRSKVGSRVYKITGNTRQNSGGTGFAVKGKTGITYIVTNAHVCKVSPNKVSVVVVDNDGQYMWRRILFVSDRSDLCLVEGVPGVNGLNLGSEPSIGQIVASVGHPSLMPITLSRGEIIGPEDVAFVKGIIIDPNNPEDKDAEEFIDEESKLTLDQCSEPKNTIIKRKVDILWISFNVRLCLDVTKNAYRTNMLIQPGSSGSPVVDFWGNVVGVVFAADQFNWGLAVSYSDLKQLLSMY